MFTLFLPEGGSHKGTRDCEAQNCGKSTREGKPFCSRHVEQSPYIQKVLAALRARDREAKGLDQGCGDAPRNGFFVRETQLLLRMNNYTSKGLARKLDLNHGATERLIHQMAKWGIAIANRTSRGDLTISGLEEPDLREES